MDDVRKERILVGLGAALVALAESGAIPQPWGHWAAIIGAALGSSQLFPRMRERRLRRGE